MTSRDVYKIPAQRIGRCSLSQEAVDINHIVVARNCEGPSQTELALLETGVINDDSPLDDLSRDISVSDDDTYMPACRNRGFCNLAAASS